MTSFYSLKWFPHWENTFTNPQIKLQKQSFSMQPTCSCVNLCSWCCLLDDAAAAAAAAAAACAATVPTPPCTAAIPILLLCPTPWWFTICAPFLLTFWFWSGRGGYPACCKLWCDPWECCAAPSCPPAIGGTWWPPEAIEPAGEICTWSLLLFWYGGYCCSGRLPLWWAISWLLRERSAGEFSRITWGLLMLGSRRIEGYWRICSSGTLGGTFALFLEKGKEAQKFRFF